MSTKINDQKLFEFIKREVDGILLTWTLAENLFDESEDTSHIQIIKNDAPITFSIIQNSIYTSLITRISRLMDPECQGNNKNLSLDSFKKTKGKFEANTQKDTITEIKNSWNESKIKEIRNKILSHNDAKINEEENHKITFLLTTSDLEAFRKIIDQLRNLIKTENLKMRNTSYSDENLIQIIKREISIFNRSILAD